MRRDLFAVLAGALFGALAASTGLMLAAGLAGRGLDREKPAVLWSRNIDRFGTAALLIGALAGGVAGGVAGRRRTTGPRR